MAKSCSSCGSEMDLTLRSVYFNKVIELKNVPVFTCLDCKEHEMIHQVKMKMKNVLNKIGVYKEKRTIYFDKYSEFAQLIVMAYHQQDNLYREDSIRTEIEELIEGWMDGQFVEEDSFEKVAHQKLEKLVH